LAILWFASIKIYLPKQMAAAGLDYYSMGRAAAKISHPTPLERRIKELK
jgi:hypothetical protein